MAWLFTGIRDPMERPTFAGDEEEMVSISGFRKAQADLNKQILDLRKKVDTTPFVEPTSTAEGATEPASGGRVRGPRKKWKGKNDTAGATEEKG